MNPIKVLFLCTGNSARSIIAEALLRHRNDGTFEVYSAGIGPKGINPYTVKVLEQAGLSLDGLASKPVSQFEGDTFDYVITVCDQAAEQCPVFPGAADRIHWSLTDPAAVEGNDHEKLAAFEATLSEMRQRIDLFTAIAKRDSVRS